MPALACTWLHRRIQLSRAREYFVTSDRTQFLAAADQIGRRLCRDAIWADGQCNWLGWSMDFRGGQWVPAYRAMSSLLYDGTAGIGLFLARLAHLTADAITRTTATGALAQALSMVERLAEAGEYGFYSGLSGIARSCMEAGALLQSDALSERGRKTLFRAARIAPHPQRLDAINGSAGLIPTLLDAAHGADESELLDAAVAHAEQLLALACHSDDGWSWDTLGTPGQPNLLGYSHGTAGIACALAEVAHASGRDRFLEAAREALRYERSYFRPAQGNWPDLRIMGAAGGTEPACMVAWCHGAPGIGMGRLRISRVLPDQSAALEEAEIAIRTTVETLGQLAGEQGGSFSLCHGSAGNADLLLLGADDLNRPELRVCAEETGSRGIAYYEEQRSPWPCGVPGAGETPNLMLGLAGIGYFYLRLHDSTTTPSILCVRPSLD
jgi:lantibiotic modifying enzyme